MEYHSMSAVCAECGHNYGEHRGVWCPTIMDGQFRLAPTISLEVGKTYRRRDGAKVKVVENFGSSWRCDDVFLRNADGTAPFPITGERPDLDLIEEVKTVCVDIETRDHLSAPGIGVLWPHIKEKWQEVYGPIGEQTDGLNVVTRVHDSVVVEQVREVTSEATITRSSKDTLPQTSPLGPAWAAKSPDLVRPSHQVMPEWVLASGRQE
jgi:hypothetical protein